MLAISQYQIPRGGYKVTFPATAMNWNAQSGTSLIFADGTTKDVTNYFVTSSKTFENIVGMATNRVEGSFYYLRMSINKGKVLTIRVAGGELMANTTIPPNTTPTMFGNSTNTWFVFLEDTTISAIEMYNTD